MFTILTILHVFVCLFLIFIVLIQSSKGAEIGAAFGGSSQTLFGSRGAATFLNKLTTVVAVIFMITSISLAVLSAKRGSVVLEQPPPKEVPAKSPPVVPRQGEKAPAAEGKSASSGSQE